MRHILLLAGLSCCVSLSSLSQAEDWLRFRGPNGSGIASESTPTPVTWSPSENIKWKLKLPGPGSSSPIVVGDKVLVTCWSGYGTNRENPGNQEDLKRHLVCVDRKTGEELWSKALAAYLPEDEYGGMFAEHGYASHTPVSDGENVYVFFGKSGAKAFDLDGKLLWERNLGTGSDSRNWGSASSPILFEDLLIVTAAPESLAMVALNKKTGEEVWRQEAEGFQSVWGTPILVKVDEQRTDVVLGVPFEIWGFNPRTGKLRWYASALENDSYSSSVVSDGKFIYASEGRSGGSASVKTGGEKDVSATHVAWKGNDRNSIGTPLVLDGRLYLFSGSALTCLDAATGSQLYQARMQAGGGTAAPPADSPRQFGGGPPGGGPPGGGFQGGGRGRGGMGGQNYASAVAADGKIYFQSRNGTMFVLKSGEKYEQLAANRVTEATEDFSATPAISNGELFIRSSGHLYCISAK